MWTPYKDGLFVAMAAALAISISVIVALLPSTTDPHRNKQAENHKAGLDGCHALLQSLGYIAATEDGQSKDSTVDQKANADLCQQIRMAKAAEDTAKISSHQFWVGIGNLVLLIFATVAAGAAAKFAKDAATEGRRAADEALNSNIIAKRAQLASERPRLIMNSRILGPLERVDDGIDITVACDIQNTGRSPANAVFIHISTYVHAIGVDPPYDPQTKMRNAIEEAKSRFNTRVGHLLFPDEPLTQHTRMTITNEDIERSTQKVGFLNVTVSTVVTYAFSQVDSQSLHCTAKLYDLQTFDQRLIGIDRLQIGGAIPEHELRLSQSFIVPGYAD